MFAALASSALRYTCGFREHVLVVPARPKRPFFSRQVYLVRLVTPLSPGRHRAELAPEPEPRLELAVLGRFPFWRDGIYGTSEDVGAAGAVTSDSSRFLDGTEGWFTEFQRVSGS